MGEVTVNQHYIPQCMLINFSNKDDQVYECLLGKRRIYLTNIKNSMVERYTYEHPYFEINRIERWFERIESYTGPAIRQILETVNNHENGNIAFNLVPEIVNKYMATFLIFYYRSGALLHEYSFGRQRKNDRVLIMTKKLMNSKYLRGLGKTVVHNYNFAIIKCAHGKFLMSDQFISTAALGIKNKFLNISNRHMGLKDTLILLPISKNFYAIYFHGNAPHYIIPNKINILDEHQVGEINNIIINNAYVKCISYSHEALEDALKNFEYNSPSEIIAGSDEGPSFGVTLKKEIFVYYEDQRAWELIESYNMKRWGVYKKVGRNDICPCGSNKKYKYCCSLPLRIAQRIIAPFAANQVFPFASVNIAKDAVSSSAIIEKPIEEW